MNVNRIGPRPSQVSSKPSDSMVDYPICSSVPSGPEQDGSALIESGALLFKQPLVSIPSIGDFKWCFGLNYQSDSNVDGILGKGWDYPQNVYIEKIDIGPVKPGTSSSFSSSRSSQSYQPTSSGSSSSGSPSLKRYAHLALHFGQNITEVFEYDKESDSYINISGNSTQSHLVQRLVEESSFSESGNGPAPLTEGPAKLVEEFILSSPDGSLTSFYGLDEDFQPSGNSAPGRRKETTDRFGNKQRYEWDLVVSPLGPRAVLTKVIDPYGREIDYSYHLDDPFKMDLVREIEDFMGRKINFQYNGRTLIAVVTPSINDAVDTGSDDNKFPNGRAYVFRTIAGSTHDLVKAIYYPEQTKNYIDSARVVDVSGVYDNEVSRVLAFYDNPGDDRITVLHIGVPFGLGAGGVLFFNYQTTGLPTNQIDPGDPIVSRTTVTDRNGNKHIYDFNDNRMPVRIETEAQSPPKNSLQADSFVMWTRYFKVDESDNTDRFNKPLENQPVEIILPEGNRVEYTYETAQTTAKVVSNNPYQRRIGLVLEETQYPSNNKNINIPNPPRQGSNGQDQLTRSFIYDPIYNTPIAITERRGNPVTAGGTYFPPQNGGSASAQRYTTTVTLDYQKNSRSLIETSRQIRDHLFPGVSIPTSRNYVSTLIDHVDAQMKNNGLSSGFIVGAGDINGDGTGEGASATARDAGSVVKVDLPPAKVIGADDDQERVILYTHNDRGQPTTATDPEGNVTVIRRYRESQPTGPDLASGKRYGFMEKIGRDIDPTDVLSSGWLSTSNDDLLAFKTNVFPRDARSNTGINGQYDDKPYQELVTEFFDPSAPNKPGYDPLANVLIHTNPRGFTSTIDRTELGEAYRITTSAPYSFKREIWYDANRNLMRVDVEAKNVTLTEDKHVDVVLDDETTANLPMTEEPGNSTRPGWFTQRYEYDILDDLKKEINEAVTSAPEGIVYRYGYDRNQNLILIEKPIGNRIEYDYDERDIQFAERAGMPDSSLAAITVKVFDRNGSLTDIISPARRNPDDNCGQTVQIGDAFGQGPTITHEGDWVAHNTYDGFDRMIKSRDALGDHQEVDYDPDGRTVETRSFGTIGGTSPTTPDDKGVLLARAIARFDEGGRPYEQEFHAFVIDSRHTEIDYALPVKHEYKNGLASNTVDPRNGSYDMVDASGTATGDDDNKYVLTRTNYDRSGRPAEQIDDNSQVVTFKYDGANRMYERTDPLGNTAQTVHDNSDNIYKTKNTQISTLTDAEPETFESHVHHDVLDRAVLAWEQGPRGTLDPNDRLQSVVGFDSRNNQTYTEDPKRNTSRYEFDGANRITRTLVQLRKMGEGTGEVIGDIITTTTLDNNDRVLTLKDANGNETGYTYDTLDRQTLMTYPDNKTRVPTYNKASDLIGLTDENGSAFQFNYDAGGRRTSVLVTSLGGGAIGNSGTVQTFEYDGLNRMTMALDNAVADSRGSVENRWIYDSLGRMIAEGIKDPDGDYNAVTSKEFISYPRTLVTYPQSPGKPNGREIDCFYDEVYRKMAMIEVSPSKEIADWQFYGGAADARVAKLNLGDCISCSHVNDLGTHSAVQSGVNLPPWGGACTDRLGYDGVGRTIGKRYFNQCLPSSSSSFSGSSAHSSPSSVGSSVTPSSGGPSTGSSGSGGPSQTPSSGSPSGEPSSGGPSASGASSRASSSSMGPSSSSSLCPTCFDPPIGCNLIAGFTSKYDPASNKLFERLLHAECRSFLYPADRYDSADRILRFDRGRLQGGGKAIDTQTSLPGADVFREYNLDLTGNWVTENSTPALKWAVRDPGGSGHCVEEEQDRTTNNLNQVATLDGSSLTYDANGNLTDDLKRTFKYDAFNRLRQVFRKNEGGGQSQIAEYSYDAAGRRCYKKTLNGGFTEDLPNDAIEFLHDGDQCVRETVGPTGDELQAREYVWGQYVDELIQLRDYKLNTVSEEISDEEVFYPLCDLLYRTNALVDEQGQIVEAYDTDIYGRTRIYAEPGPDERWFTDDDIASNETKCPYLFTGRYYDQETQLYYYRARCYHPELGRFISRDPLGYNAGANLYEYGASNPTNTVDPSGNLAFLIVAAPFILGGGYLTGEAVKEAAETELAAQEFMFALEANNEEAAAKAAEDLVTHYTAMDKYSRGAIYSMAFPVVLGTAYVAAPVFGWVAGAVPGGGLIMGGAGLTVVGIETADIVTNWNEMDNIDRVGRISLLGAGVLGGGMNMRGFMRGMGRGARVKLPGLKLSLSQARALSRSTARAMAHASKGMPNKPGAFAAAYSRVSGRLVAATSSAKGGLYPRPFGTGATNRVFGALQAGYRATIGRLHKFPQRPAMNCAEPRALAAVSMLMRPAMVVATASARELNAAGAAKIMSPCSSCDFFMLYGGVHAMRSIAGRFGNVLTQSVGGAAIGSAVND